MREIPQVPLIPKKATEEQLLRQQQLQKMRHSRSVYNRGVQQGILSAEITHSHEQTIATAQTAKELIHFLRNTPLFFGNAHSGLDHSEHIIKRVELSLKLRCSRLTPEQLGVRKKIASFMKGWERKDRPIVKNEEYQHYLQKKYPDLHFSQREFDRISQKVPVDIFGSLDERSERVILLLNSFEDVETRFSCAGHDDNHSPLEYKGEENSFRNMYVSFSTRSTNTVDAIRSFTLTYKDTNISINFEDDGDGNYRIMYGIIQPPSEWIKKHTHRSAEQIFADIKEEIIDITGKSIPINVKNGEDPLAELSKVLIERIRNTGEEEKDTLEKLERLLPSIQTGNEWREYFLSHEAKIQGDSFLNALEVTLQSLREK